MAEDKTIDCRGLLCPEPVLRVKKELDSMPGGGRFIVLADSAAARDNVVRLASGRGWQVKVTEESGAFRLEIINAKA